MVASADDPLIELSAQDGAASTSSVALTPTCTGTILPFGGQIAFGVTDSSVMTGAVVSGGTTTFTERALWLPARSEQLTFIAEVRPPPARTSRGKGPRMTESPAAAPAAVTSLR